MVTRPGYEYRYAFRAYDEVIPRKLLCLGEILFFEIRTNFILRKRLGDEEDVIGSERLDMCVGDRNSDERFLKNWMKGHRLQAYWMSDDEIDSLISGAFSFAKQRAADNPRQLVTAVVVDLDVCTVQLERETADEAFARSIRGECLVPAFLLPSRAGRNDEIRDRVNFELQCFLMYRLEKIRVEDSGLNDMMDTCPICLCGPIIGAHVTVLPSCGHAFHYHCIVRWLVKSNLCPLCRFPAHTFPVYKNLPPCIS